MRHTAFVLLIILALAWPSTSAHAQEDDTSFVFEDDPIAAMIDSLAGLNYFEKSNKHINNKFEFPLDSVPRYDEAYYQAKLAKLDAQSPFDLKYHPEVKGFIELYTIRKRELVSRMMGLAQFYFPLFEEMLDKYDMPLELKYLAIVESALNPTAKSKAGAMGMWQFMYGTGKMYNLKVTSYVDERCDVYKSTEAACEFLTHLYGTFGDWQLALAAYNSGPGNVNKAIRRSGGKKTFWEIAPYLPRETQGYVPAFIAVNYVMNHTAEHNLYASVPKKTFLQIDTVNVKYGITFEQLSAVLNIPVEDIAYLNPTYKRNFIPGPYNGNYFTLCLPANKVGSFVTNEQAIYDYLKKDTTSPAILVAHEATKIHTVRSGEHLNMIANRYKCSVTDLKAWNGLRSNYLKAGQKLTVHVSAATTAKTTVAKQAPVKKIEVASTTNANYKYHTVKSGDTLWDLAQNYSTSVEKIRKLNNFGKYYKLMPGTKIKVGFSG